MRPHRSVERLRSAVRALKTATRSGRAVLQSPPIARDLGRLLLVLATVLLVAGFALLLPVTETRIQAPSHPIALPSIEAVETAQGLARQPDHGLLQPRVVPIPPAGPRPLSVDGPEGPDGAPAASTWGVPTTSDTDYQLQQTQAEHTVERWMDASGVTGLEVQVSPTGVRHEASWCQAVWNQGTGTGRADGYGTTPAQACATLLTQAVQHYPALARRAVLRGVRLP